MIVYSVTSLLETDAPVVLHGVNARGAFGSGVAGAMARAWPSARADYLKAHAEGRVRLGEVVWGAAGGRTVGHMVTQMDYGRAPGRVYVDYGAVEGCLRRVARAAAEGIAGTTVPEGFAAVSLPKVGAGLAGGDWRRIEEILERECGHLDVTVHVLTREEIPEWRRSPAPRS